MRLQRDKDLRSSAGVSGVVAIILLVAITVVLTAFLYVIVANIAQTPSEIPPRVLLTNTGNPAGQSDFLISSSDPRPLTEFQLRLWIGGQLDLDSEMRPVAPGTVGNLTFRDLDAGGTMTDGDSVAVRTAPGLSYEIVLLWKGNLESRQEWTT